MKYKRTLVSFSKNNADVYEILEKKKEENVNISEYICKCIRFYEKNNNVDIDEKINNSVKAAIANMLISNGGAIAINDQNMINNEAESTIVENTKKNLEEDINLPFELNLEDD